jgi:thiol-disulfide isomerase/thioredoxin
MVDKSKIKLSSLRGKVVLMDFFWSQCPHCRDHAPHVAELFSQYKGKNFAVLGLATDGPEKVSDVKAFMRDTKINYPVGYINTELIAYYTDSHNHGVPQMVLFGTNGKMVKRLIGWNEETSRDLVAAIKGQLGDPAPTATKSSGTKTGARTAARRTPRT